MLDNGEWKTKFKAVFDRAAAVFENDGGRTPEECIGPEDRAFLESIGCTAQEVYDFVEDCCWSGEPTFEEVLAVTAIQREHFLEARQGAPAERKRSPGEFPAGTDEVAGIPWLPRILAKARAKLRGELPRQLMYGCGGDRPFLRSMGVGLAEFLAAVRAAGDNDQPVIDLLVRRVKRG